MTEYTRYSANLFKYKSPFFLSWAKQKFPYLDLHHILSKKIDYLVYPFEHEYHLGFIHQNKSRAFEIWLRPSVELLAEYIDEKFFKVYGQMLSITSYEPEDLKLIFEKLQGWEREKL